MRKSDGIYDPMEYEAHPERYTSHFRTSVSRLLLSPPALTRRSRSRLPLSVTQRPLGLFIHSQKQLRCWCTERHDSPPLCCSVQVQGRDFHPCAHTRTSPPTAPGSHGHFIIDQHYASLLLPRRPSELTLLLACSSTSVGQMGETSNLCFSIPCAVGLVKSQTCLYSFLLATMAASLLEKLTRLIAFFFFRQANTTIGILKKLRRSLVCWRHLCRLFGKAKARWVVFAGDQPVKQLATRRS